MLGQASSKPPQQAKHKGFGRRAAGRRRQRECQDIDGTSASRRVDVWHFCRQIARYTADLFRQTFTIPQRPITLPCSGKEKDERSAMRAQDTESASFRLISFFSNFPVPR